MNWTTEQLNAINSENTNIIVSAGAGSGKTAVLTERVLRKLKSGIPVSKLLILTFTNLAAKEMKDRIKDKLKKQNMKEQLLLIDQSYITTFDSYALSLVRKYHYKLNISKNISISDSSIIELELSKTVEEVFNNNYKNNSEKFLKLIGDFCVRDDKEIKKMIINIYHKISLKYDKEEYLNNYIDNYYNDSRLTDLIHEYVNNIIDNIELLKIKLNELENYVEVEYLNKLRQIIYPLLESNTYSDIKINSNITLPNLKKGTDEEGKTIKSVMTNIIKTIKNNCHYENEQEIKNEILNTKKYSEAITSILKEIIIKMNNYKTENEIYDFNDIACLSIKLLKENHDIRENIKNEFKEIMVDEYQDTSDLQETFINLIENNNVYMVGDIKQSIYRFRNANPSIFKNKYDLYNDNTKGIRINLNQNFRSRKEVIDTINLIFNNIMYSDLGGANYKEEHQMIYGNTTFDKYNSSDYNLSIINYNYEKNSNYKKEEIESFIIINDIKNKVENHYKIIDKETKKERNVEYKDFTILIDRMTTSSTIKKIFEYMNIPITIYSDNTITNNDEINLISSIIKLIIKTIKKEIDKEYKHLFLSIGRSYLMEYTDEYLFDIITNNLYKETTLYTKINELTNNINNPINELIIKILETFNYYEKLLKTSDIEENILRMDYIIELSNTLSNQGYDIYTFDNYLSEISKNKLEIKYSSKKESSNAVSLMTIHGSKGLEFNICYYIGLDKEFNTSDLKERIFYDKLYGIITPYFEEGIGNTILNSLVKNNYYKEETGEKIRLLYVALTRTKEKLILIIPDFTEENNILIYKNFKDMLMNINNKINNFITTIDLDKINITLSYKNKSINNSIKDIGINQKKINVTPITIDNNYIEEKNYSKKSNKVFTKEEKKKLEYGEYIHYILEIIDFKNNNINSLDIPSKIKEKLSNFLNSEIIINAKNAKIYKEYEFIIISNDIKHHGIIDLMLEYDDYINIVDYKLKNIDDENYIKQLNGYKEYIENKTNKKVNIYLYSIIDEKLKEITKKI